MCLSAAQVRAAMDDFFLLVLLNTFIPVLRRIYLYIYICASKYNNGSNNNKNSNKIIQHKNRIVR